MANHRSDQNSERSRIEHQCYRLAPDLRSDGDLCRLDRGTDSQLQTGVESDCGTGLSGFDCDNAHRPLHHDEPQEGGDADRGTADDGKWTLPFRIIYNLWHASDRWD